MEKIIIYLALFSALNICSLLIGLKVISKKIQENNQQQQNYFNDYSTKLTDVVNIVKTEINRLEKRLPK